jgi:hypothetical protein
MNHDFAHDRILMDIFPMLCEVTFVADSMICEAALPYLASSTDDRAKIVRIRAFDQLHGALDRDCSSWRKQEMDVIGHQYKFVQSEPALTAIAVQSFEKQARVVFNYEQAAALPC